jgi:hypothetical protein
LFNIVFPFLRFWARNDVSGIAAFAERIEQRESRPRGVEEPKNPVMNALRLLYANLSQSGADAVFQLGVRFAAPPVHRSCAQRLYHGVDRAPHVRAL